MEVTALCIRLMLGVLVLLVAQVHHSYFAQKADAASLCIVPDRLQFIEYETVSIHCEENDGFTRWRVKTKLNKINLTNSDCNTSAPSCTINPTFERHSGEYWCEDEEGEKSDAVNISVTAGSVILESPTHPVLEGDDVILYCKNKKTQTQHIADFYKDGSRLGTGYTGNMTIQNVSKSDEGLYKCSISEAGESPESWLKISNQTSYEKTTDSPQSPNSPQSPHSRSPHLLTPLWIVVSILLMAPLGLAVELLLCKKHKDPDVSRADTKPLLPEEKDFYSTVIYRPLTEGLRRRPVQSTTCVFSTCSQLRLSNTAALYLRRSYSHTQ